MKLNIGKNIRNYRRNADMTQEQLAELLGVSYQSVSRWENGTTYPDLELIPMLAQVFSVTIDDLMNNVKEEQRLKHMLVDSYIETDRPGGRSLQNYYYCLD